VGALVEFNWPALRAIEGKVKLEQEAIWYVLTRGALATKGFFMAVLRTGRRGICGRSKFSGGIDPITQAIGYAMR
jgi:hypothetical protein